MSFSWRGAWPSQLSTLGLSTAEALGPNRTVAELIPYVVQVWSDAKKLELLVTLPRKGVSPFFMWLLNLHPALRTYVFNTYVGYAEISADRWCKRSLCATTTNFCTLWQGRVTPWRV